MDMQALMEVYKKLANSRRPAQGAGEHGRKVGTLWSNSGQNPTSPPWKVRAATCEQKNDFLAALPAAGVYGEMMGSSFRWHRASPGTTTNTRKYVSTWNGFHGTAISFFLKDCQRGW